MIETCDDCRKVLDNLFTGIVIVAHGERRMKVCNDCAVKLIAQGWHIIAYAK